jgi:hypothetical protein
MPRFIDYDATGNIISDITTPDPPPPPPDGRSAQLAATRILIAPTVRTLDAQPALADLAPLFPAWAPGEAVKVADFRTFNGAVFECVQAHTTQTGWEPPVVPALWKQYRAPGAQWVQPLGAPDSYPLGAVVADEGFTWRATLANNVWKPGVAGWVKI